MNEFEPFLADAVGRHELVAFHRHRDAPEIFLVGFVLECDPEGVRTSLVNPDGSFDEERFIPWASLQVVHRKSVYLKRLLKLHERSGEAVDASRRTRGAKQLKRIKSLLQEAVDTGRAIRIMWATDTSDLDDAFVMDLDDKTVTIEQVLEDARTEGIYRIDLSLVRHVTIDSEGSQEIEFLRKIGYQTQ